MAAVVAASSSITSSKRWTPVNSQKNLPITIIFQCSWSGERITVPTTAPAAADDTANYFDESSSDDGHIYGSTTLQDAIKSVKGKMPALYLMEEHGSATMVCGSNQVPRSEWETTMLCHLVFDQKDDSQVEQVILKDGRIGFVVQLGGTAEKKAEKPTVVTRCLAKNDVYG